MRTSPRTWFSFALLLAISCTKSDSSPKPPSHPPAVTKQLIDGTLLRAPQVEITKGQVCNSETFKIHVLNSPSSSEYFEFKFCDPSKPESCVPVTIPSASFAGTDIELPNLFDNVDTPLFQMRSCVRPYDAKDATQNCSQTWQTMSSPAVHTKKVVSELLWEKFLDQRKVTEQCGYLRKALEAFENRTQGQIIEIALSNAVSAGLSIGVDACELNINSGQLELIAAEVQGELGSSTDTKIATSKSSETSTAIQEGSAAQNATASTMMALSLMTFFVMVRDHVADKEHESKKTHGISLLRVIGAPILVAISGAGTESALLGAEPRQELFNALAQIGNQITSIRGDLNSLQQQIDACAGH